ncbi:hypothetical protein PYCC9005_005093 [Savitreella phatthalungensis]
MGAHHLPRGCAATDAFGHNVSRIVERLTGECVYGNRALFSWSVGWMSLACWLQAQIPQVLLNIQRGSAEGISASFLLIWLVGDIANLVGCIMTEQLPFQTLLALYYCFVDSCLVVQYVWYTLMRQQAPLIDGIEPRGTHGAGLSRLRGSFSSLFKAAIIPGAHAAPLFAPILDLYTLGTAASWLSSVLYLTSRVPQIRLNWQRKSTFGTSILLFTAAFFGNLCYTLSILTSPYASSEYGQSSDEIRGFLFAALPFLIGASGTLVFDAVIGAQWLIYRPRGQGRILTAERLSYGTFADVDWILS